MMEVTQMNYVITSESQNSGYGLDNCEVVVGRPAGIGFSLLQSALIGTRAHPASCDVITRGSFHADKAAGA